MSLSQLQGWSIFKWHIDFTLRVFQIYKFSLLYFKLKKVMTFFLGMNYKFSLYIFQLFPKFDLKHQFTSIFTKIFPIYLQDFQIFPLIEILGENFNKFSPFSSKMNKFPPPPRFHQLEDLSPLLQPVETVEASL